MDNEIRLSVQGVADAVDRLNQVFKKKADQLREGGQTEELQDWVKAQAAMRDSGAIYLSWANHYAKTSSKDGEEMREDDMLEIPSN